MSCWHESQVLISVIIFLIQALLLLLEQRRCHLPMQVFDMADTLSVSLPKASLLVSACKSRDIILPRNCGSSVETVLCISDIDIIYIGTGCFAFNIDPIPRNGVAHRDGPCSTVDSWTVVHSLHVPGRLLSYWVRTLDPYLLYRRRFCELPSQHFSSVRSLVVEWTIGSSANPTTSMFSGYPTWTFHKRGPRADSCGKTIVTRFMMPLHWIFW